jgi:hypothetical protein
VAWEAAAGDQRLCHGGGLGPSVGVEDRAARAGIDAGEREKLVGAVLRELCCPADAVAVA